MKSNEPSAFSGGRSFWKVAWLRYVLPSLQRSRVSSPSVTAAAFDVTRSFTGKPCDVRPV